MNYTFRFLSPTDITVVYLTNLKAFADYAVDMSYMSETVIHNRAIKNGIDFNASVGAFYKNEMVGFTLTGIDFVKGRKSAFDIATGIIKEHRGKGLAKQMLDYAIPYLEKQGVKNFYLEVLQVNEPAIKAYHKTGFEITREFDCYLGTIDNLNINKKTALPIEISTFDINEIDHYEHFMDWEPSWENSMNSIKRIENEVISLCAKLNDTLIGLLLYYPTVNWIMHLSVQFELRRKGIGSALLNHLTTLLPDHIKSLKVVNVSPEDHAFKSFLLKNGFEYEISQYEMRKGLCNGD